MEAKVNLIDYDLLMAELDRRLEKKLDEIIFASKFADLPDLIKVPVASRLTGISSRTLNDMVNDGRIKASRKGRHNLIHKSEIIKIIKA